MSSIMTLSPTQTYVGGRKCVKSVLVEYVTSGCGTLEHRKSFLVNFHYNFCRKCPEGANDSTQGVAARVTSGCGQPLLRARQKSASWLLVGCGEIEKLEFDPIIMSPDNPLRLHLLRILRILREVLGKTYFNIFNIQEENNDNIEVVQCTEFGQMICQIIALTIWRPSIWRRKVIVLICIFL